MHTNTHTNTQGRIFIAPFGSGRVRFADFWIADQLVSIVPLFLDLEYLFCFYTTDDVLSKSHLTASFVSKYLERFICLYSSWWLQPFRWPPTELITYNNISL